MATAMAHGIMDSWRDIAKITDNALARLWSRKARYGKMPVECITKRTLSLVGAAPFENIGGGCGGDEELRSLVVMIDGVF
jgi:hypothetical protein